MKFTASTAAFLAAQSLKSGSDVTYKGKFIDAIRKKAEDGKYELSYENLPNDIAESLEKDGFLINRTEKIISWLPNTQEPS